MPDDYLQYCIYLPCWNILAVKSKKLFHHKELPKLSGFIVNKIPPLAGEGTVHVCDLNDY